MRVTLITASNRQPRWVDEGFDEYARRLRAPVSLELKEIALGRRTASAPPDAALAREGERMLAALPRDAQVVALDERGAQWSTLDLAERLKAWRADGRPVCVLIGGPDGLAQPCMERAGERWALSHLTLPHGLVRVVVAEALYRAASLLEGHPYHRA